jgi:ribosomal protein L7/L12
MQKHQQQQQKQQHMARYNHQDGYLVRAEKDALKLLSESDVTSLVAWMNTPSVQALKDHPKHRQHFTNAISLLAAASKSISQFEIDYKDDPTKKVAMIKSTLDCTVRAFTAVKDMIDGIGGTLKSQITLPSMFADMQAGTTFGGAVSGIQPGMA